MDKLLCLHFIAFLLLFFSPFLSTSKHFNEIMKEKYENLKLVRKIRLHENDSVVLTNVTNVSTNSNSSKILISDAKGKILILFDANTGKIIKSFEAGLNFSDSLAIKGKYWNDEYRYVTKDKIRDKSGKPMTEEFLKKRLANEIINGVFYNDQEILASAHIRCFAIPTDTNQKDKGINIGLATGLIKINLENESNAYFPLEQLPYAFPQGYFFAIDSIRNNIVIITKNFPALWNNFYDSLWIIGSYSFDGKLINLVAKLPEEYTQTKLGYKMLHEPRFCFNDSNELLCVFPYAERIFNLTKGLDFKLQSLPHSNKVYLDSLIDDPDLQGEFLQRYFYFLPITIDNIYTRKNNNIIITLFHVFKFNDSLVIRERIIQEYTPDGKLVKQYKFNNNDGDTYINFIYYDKYKDEFLIIKSSKSQGWIIDFYKSD